MNTAIESSASVRRRVPRRTHEPMKPPVPFGLSPGMFGGLCCVVSVVLYGSANICMRHLAYVGCNDNWAICNREIVSFTIMIGYFIWQALAGRLPRISVKAVALLLAAGLAAQLLGNTGVQWAYGVAGLEFIVSSNQGFNLMAGAALGYLVLGERINKRHITAITILIMAVGLLWLGAKPVESPQSPTGGTYLIAAALAASLFAGVLYALQNISIRYCVTQGTPITVVVALITGCGTCTLGPWCLTHHVVQSTPASCYPWMYAAGIFNFLGFLAIIRGLKFTTVAHVNTISAMQVAMAAVAGICFFGESSSGLLLAGVGLIMVGVVSFGGPEVRTAAPAPEPVAAPIAEPVHEMMLEEAEAVS